jgi:hypothetical protein
LCAGSHAVPTNYGAADDPAILERRERLPLFFSYCLLP